jgi:hypothetical protein
MKIFHLSFNEDFEDTDANGKYYVSPFSDKQGFVVIAESEARAREQAMGVCYTDSPWWLDPTVTVCIELKAEGPERVILADTPTG